MYLIKTYLECTSNVLWFSATLVLLNISINRIIDSCSKVTACDSEMPCYFGWDKISKIRLHLRNILSQNASHICNKLHKQISYGSFWFVCIIPVTCFSYLKRRLIYTMYINSPWLKFFPLHTYIIAGSIQTSVQWIRPQSLALTFHR